MVRSRRGTRGEDRKSNGVLFFPPCSLALSPPIHPTPHAIPFPSLWVPSLIVSPAGARGLHGTDGSCACLPPPLAPLRLSMGSRRCGPTIVESHRRGACLLSCQFDVCGVHIHTLLDIYTFTLDPVLPALSRLSALPIHILSGHIDVSKSPDPFARRVC